MKSQRQKPTILNQQAQEDWRTKALQNIIEANNSLARAAVSNAQAAILNTQTAVILSENNLLLARLIMDREKPKDWWVPGNRWKQGQPVKQSDFNEWCIERVLDAMIDCGAITITGEQEERPATQKQIASRYGRPAEN